jgi:peptide deformylase
MTVHTETFNKADSDTLGPDLTWTEVTGDWDVVGNGATHFATHTQTEYARADAAVSSSDNYCQAKFVSSAIKICGVATRFSSSANTAYVGWINNATTIRISKNVTGTLTNLASGTISWAQNNVYKIEANGTTINAYENGAGSPAATVTDSSIVSGTCGGFMAYEAVTTAAMFDDFEVGDIGGGGGPTISTTVGTVSAAAAVSGFGGSTAHLIGASAGLASVAGVGANANAGEREAVGTATGAATVAGVGRSTVYTVGNSAGSAAVVGAGEAVISGQGIGTAAGIATVSGVASTIVSAAGTSTGSSDAVGVNPQVVPNQRAVIVGAGGEVSWEDHVKEIHRLRNLEGQIKEHKKELRKVAKKIKAAEKQYKAEKAEGILATYLELEFKKEEIETKIQALEVDLTPLVIAAQKAEIEEDDAEFFSLIK